MSLRDPFTHTLLHPINLPTGETVTELKFPRMKGKYMRQFQAKAAADGSDGTEAKVEYDQFMAMAERMLADSKDYGPVAARLILDEMDPDDVHQVVALVGERFAGGQTTGATASR